MPEAPVSHAGHRAYFAIRSVWLKSLMASGLVVALTAPNTRAQAPGPHERSTDDRLALKVQTALANDPKLKPHDLNLLVNVVDGFAVIGGAVPSEDLLPRIRSVALDVENIRAVKVSGWIASTDRRDDPLAQKVAEQLEASKPAPKPPPVPPPPPVAAPPPGGLPPLAIPAEVPPAVPMVAPVRKEPASGSTVVRRPAPAGLFLDPIVSSAAPPTRSLAPGAAPLPYPTIPPPGVPTRPVAADNLPEPKEPRFAELTVKVSGSVATIAGKASRLTDAWDYADVVQAWPGIDTVVVGAVRVK